MKKLNLLFALFSLLMLTSFVSAQSVSSDDTKTFESTPTFRLLASHKSAVEDEIKTLRSHYTAIHPDVLNRKLELEATEREMTNLRAVSEDKLSRLDDAYGRLLISKIIEEAELRDLLGRLTARHPQVRAASEKLKATENKILEQLQ